MSKTFALLIFLANHPALADGTGVRAPQTRQEAQDMMDDAAKDYATSRNWHSALFSDAQRLTQFSQQAAKAAVDDATAITQLVQSGAPPSQVLDAVKKLQETQLSFNQNYLQLQNNMQSENRSYIAVTNIMKTKHDTVKNSISNIR